MFSTEQREDVRNRVLDLAKADPRVTGGALTGSSTMGAEDEWSDVDVAFGIADAVGLETVLDSWTEALDHEYGVLHHWDLRSGSSIYRVFLLACGLQVDVGVSSEQDFGARGPTFRLLFGAASKQEPAPQPNAQYAIGLGWHHVLHARSCIERGKPWGAEYWISAVRDQTLTLACLRLGEDAFYGRGTDRLPADVKGPIAGALVRSLDDVELRRALGVATTCFIRELGEWDPVLCARLSPPLREFGAPQG